MDENLQQLIKAYLKENMSLDISQIADLYGNNPDEVKINILLDGEVIASGKINPTYDWS
jgi:hypothetical protein